MNNDFLSKPFSCKDKPSIKYPCSWVYKIIGSNEEALKKAVSAIIGNKNVVVTSSKRSSGGKYVSLNVEVLVLDEDSRQQYYQHFKNHTAVKVVM